MTAPDDDREWIEISTLGGTIKHVPGPCRHSRLVDVDLSLTGEVVAQLCLSCWGQLPAGWDT